MSDMNNDYYFKLLNKAQQQAYHQIYQGLLAAAPSFSVARLTPRELADIYFMVRMDHPEIFYTNRFTYRFYENALNVEMVPEYIFDKKKIKDHRQAMESRIAKLARQAEKLPEKEKFLYVHDFICQNVTYDKLKKAYSHEIIGPLGTGVGVCEGIAKTVKALCDKLGLWCIIALCDNNPEKKIKYRHTWNVIRVDGKYYHMDATFDNSLGKKDLGLIRYDYFKLPDQQIRRDHEPSIYPLPECTDGSATYYQEKKISFTKLEEVGKRAAQFAKKGKPFVFHWRGGYLTKEVLAELVSQLKTAAETYGKQGSISVNWGQAVISVFFTEEPSAQAEPVLEQANEGELYGEGEVQA